MDKPKKMIDNFLQLQTKNKILVLLSIVITIVLIVSIPVLAWFSDMRKMATMAKVDSPAKLSLKSGAKEDIIQFKMSGIDVTQSSPKYFVFCVEGDDISRYNIQLAHTTNINFTYNIYKATTSASDNGIEYVKADTSKAYYEKSGESLPGTYVNAEQDSVDPTRTIGNTLYEAPSYDNESDPLNGKFADNRQKFAEPLYWQTSAPITAEDPTYDEDNDLGPFTNFYVLEVSWGDDVVNDKETDIVYLTVQVA